MNITLRDVDVNNFHDVIALHVEEYCASNEYSLAQAKVQPECIPMAIYNDETVVGFLMYCIDRDDGNYWIYRLMIDEKYQKNGYGKKALEIIIEKIKQDKTHNKINISTEPENVIAIKLYKKLGFNETGNFVDDEIVLALEY